MKARVGTLIVLVILISLPSLLYVETGTYGNSWVVYERPSGKILGRERISYSGPNSAMVYDVIEVTVTIEYIDDEYAKMDCVRISEVSVTLRAKEKGGPKKYIGCEDEPTVTHNANVRLKKGEKYVHTFQLEVPSPGEYYIVVFWTETWYKGTLSIGDSFTTDIGEEDPEGVAGNMTLKVLPPKDSDGDGLYDSIERKLGLDPSKQDSDGDGIKDGDEDADGDGLSNAEELKANTDILAQDTDGDGLLDGEEISYGTSPLKEDTDGDMLSDSEEVKVYETDPTKQDTDGDKLSDSEEIRTTHTDPLNPDTDGDGILDGDEKISRFRSLGFFFFFGGLGLWSVGCLILFKKRKLGGILFLIGIVLMVIAFL